MKRLFKRSLYIAIVLDLIGLVLILFPYAIVGRGLPQLPDPAQKFLQDAGVAFFLAGTGSFLIEELIKARTRDEFEVQMRALLGETSKQLRGGLQDFLQARISDLVKRVEALGHEIEGSNIEMIFSRRKEGLDQMARAISDAEHFIYIMGISLREFFQLETACTRAIGEAYETKRNIKFKILILNNQSVEALERSAREEGVEYKSADDFEYRSRKLFTETRRTITNIQKHCPDMDLRVYDRQSLFLLITDKVAFMEPYHYGERIVDEDTPEQRFFKRVAELVPLIEFRKEPERGPYEQFLGHFEYVFERAKEPGEENLTIRPF